MEVALGGDIDDAESGVGQMVGAWPTIIRAAVGVFSSGIIQSDGVVPVVHRPAKHVCIGPVYILECPMLWTCFI